MIIPALLGCLLIAGFVLLSWLAHKDPNLMAIDITTGHMVAFGFLLVLNLLFLAMAHQRHQSYERELQQSLLTKSLADSAMGVIQEAVITTNLKGQITYCNLAAFDLIQRFRKQEVLGHYLNKVLPLEGSGWMLDMSVDEWASTEGQPHELAVSIGNDTIHIEQTHFMINANKKSQGVVWVLKDSTEQVQQIQALRYSESFWSSILRALPDTVYVNDLVEKRTLYASRHVASLIGYSDETVNHIRHWKSLVHEEDLPKVNQSIDAMKRMHPGDIKEVECRMQDPDGQWHVMRFKNSILTCDNNGEPRLFVGTGRDISDDVAAKQSIADSEHRYRILAEGISDIIFTLTKDLELTFISPSVERVLGFSPERIKRAGLMAFLSEEDHDQLKALMRKDLHEAHYTPEKLRNFRRVRGLDLDAYNASGQRIILEVHTSILWDRKKVSGVLAIARDVTAKRHLEAELQLAAEVFEGSSESIVITDYRGFIRKVNQAFRNITGYSDAEIMGREIDVMIPRQEESRFATTIRDSLINDGSWQGELLCKMRSGELKPSWTGITAIKGPDDRIQSHIIISSDISDRKASEERIQKLAFYDPLTGLPNRSQLTETLDKILQSTYQGVALLFIDLDRFKPINDSLGHSFGDEVLKEVARRVESTLRPHDYIARLGGDEFAVILPGFENQAEAQAEAIEASEHILHQLMKPFMLGERQVYISASIGIALYPQDSENAKELFKNADTAMYHAKSMGKNNFQFYAQEMNVLAVERLELEHSLHKALENREFDIFYQPIWNAKQQRISAVEALIRWRRPMYGVVSPDKFIPIIEDTGLIVPVGEWVITNACLQMARWQREGHELERISINLSARQFQDHLLVEKISRALDRSKIHPSALVIELTESILIDDVERTLSILKAIKRMGVKISIDDFGTGYSSLSYLNKFPVDHLKIDRSFVCNIPGKAADEQITRTIIAMARNLKLGVVAEGVETAEQKAFLVSLGCEEIQGYLFSRPVAADDIRALLKANPKFAT